MISSNLLSKCAHALCNFLIIPSVGLTHDNDTDEALESSLGSKGILMTSELLLFNKDSKASVCN